MVCDMIAVDIQMIFLANSKKITNTYLHNRFDNDDICYNNIVDTLERFFLPHVL